MGSITCKGGAKVPVTNYYTVEGEILGESSAAGRLDYLPDALGTVVSVVDQAKAVQGSARYGPYGSVLVSIGVQTVFGWVGIYGYRRAGLSRAEYYIRARHYGTGEGRWRSVDPFWPFEAAYSYATANPTTLVDPRGTEPEDTRQSAYDREVERQMQDPRWDRDFDQIRDCLRKHKYTCEGKPYRASKMEASTPLLMCMFWWESNFGEGNEPAPKYFTNKDHEGPGNITEGGYEDLRSKCSWIRKKFPTYESFIRKASRCEKARAAFDLVNIKGVRNYGPPYGPKVLKKLNDCAKCVGGGLEFQIRRSCGGAPIPPQSMIEKYCFLKMKLP
jgi:RHS repeat-associated protein